MNASTRRRVLLSLSLATILAIPGALAQDDTHPLDGANKTRQIAARVHQEEGYDSALIFEEEPKAKPASPNTRPSALPTPKVPKVHVPTVSFGGIVPLLYGLLAILILAILVLVIRAMTRGKSTALTDAVEADALAFVPPAAGEEWLAHAALDDADLLANQGRFAEAIAVWLARSFRQVGWNPEERGRARTIREIMLRVPSTDLRRAPLSELASITEAVRYAAFPADAALYAHSKGLAQQVIQAPPGPLT